jgi:type IV secretion system protein VirB10
MKEIESPTGLDLNPRPPGVVRLSKRAGIVALVIVTAAVGLVGYGIATRRQRSLSMMRRASTQELTAATDAGKAVAAQVPAGILTGAAGAPKLQPSGSSPKPGVRRRAAAQPALQQPPTVRGPTAEEKARLAAYQQELEALAAPTATRSGFGSESSRMGIVTSPTREGDLAQIGDALRNLHAPGPLPVGKHIARATSLGPEGGDSEEYSAQNMQDRKEAFLAQARSAAGQDNYLKATRVQPLGKYEIKAGWDIPAVLEQALNSDLPGEIRALVRENVYDTASGNYLLIPQGSRLVGIYDSRISYGQNGVAVAWNRIIFPDGSSINLEGMVGQDAKGQSGLRHDVDNHYRRLIGFAVLTSMFSAAFQLSQSRRDGLLAYPSPGEIAGSAVGRELSQLGAQVARRNLNIQPTIKVPVGYRFNVRVNRDLLFEAPYRPYRM